VADPRESPAKKVLSREPLFATLLRSKTRHLGKGAELSIVLQTNKTRLQIIRDQLMNLRKEEFKLFEQRASTMKDFCAQK